VCIYIYIEDDAVGKRFKESYRDNNTEVYST
jgi:hypothetical protein